MPYCTQCGTKCDDNNAFCPSCGASLGMGQPVPFVTSPVQVPVEKTHQQYLNEANKLRNYLAVKSAEYTKLEQMIKKYNVCQRGPRRTPLKLGFIFAGIMSAFILLAATVREVEMLILVFLFFCPSAAMFSLYIIKKYNYASTAHRLSGEIEQLSNELCRYYYAYDDCPICFEFTMPTCLSKLYEKIYIGQANTWREAITAVSQDEHYRKMEQYAADAAFYSAQAADSARSASNAANVAAIASVVNLFK